MEIAKYAGSVQNQLSGYNRGVAFLLQLNLFYFMICHGSRLCLDAFANSRRAVGDSVFYVFLAIVVCTSIFGMISSSLAIRSGVEELMQWQVNCALGIDLQQNSINKIGAVLLSIVSVLLVQGFLMTNLVFNDVNRFKDYFLRRKRSNNAVHTSFQSYRKRVMEFIVHCIFFGCNVALIEYTILTSPYNTLDTNQAYWPFGQVMAVTMTAAHFVEIGKHIDKRHSISEEHLDTLRALANLASTYSRNGRWEAAAELEEIILEGRRKSLGAEHPDTLKMMGYLVTSYHKQGRLEEASKLGEKVMEVKRKTLGMKHPETLTAMENLAAIYHEQGRLEDSAKLEEKVLEVRRRVLGVEHPDTLTAMEILAVTYHEQGQLQNSAKLKEKVLEVRRKVLGVEHPDTLTAMENLVVTYHKQGRLEDSAKLKEKVLEARRRGAGEGHPDILIVSTNLEAMNHEHGQLEDVVKLKEKALKVKRTVIEKDVDH
jgi:tetratricopeptide (TPR) repeat protein